MTVHHIGYLVKDIEKAKKKFEKLGYISEGSMVYDDLRDINIAFIRNENYVVELVSPQSPASVVADLFKKFRNSPYHICYESADLERDMKNLQEEGFVAIDIPKPAIAFDNHRVVFMMNSSVGLIELVEV